MTMRGRKQFADSLCSLAPPGLFFYGDQRIDDEFGIFFIFGGGRQLDLENFYACQCSKAKRERHLTELS